jgi:hypothetical protein
MAKLTEFILCDSISAVPASEGGVLQQLTSPQVALRPQFVPGNFSFGVVVGIQGMNLHITNRICFTIADPQGNVILESAISEVPPISEDEPETMPEEYQGVVMNMDIRNLVICENGVYLLSIYANDELVGKQSIPIFQRATK